MPGSAHDRSGRDGGRGPGQLRERFEPVRDALAERLASGDELGASIVVNVDGETVVDMWGGFRDEARTMPWTRGHDHQRLVDHQDGHEPGRADAGRPRRSWTSTPRSPGTGRSSRPAASRTSRSGTCSRTPRASPAGTSRSVTEDMYDWEKSTSQLAAQAPWWEPGTASGYHALNQGHLVGEIDPPDHRQVAQAVRRRGDRRAAGRRLPDRRGRARLGPDRRRRPAAAAAVRHGLDRPAEPGIQDDDRPGARRGGRQYARLAARRHGSVQRARERRSVARIMSALALGGEVDGIRLLGPETIDLIFDEQSNGMDLVLGVPLRFGIGYGLPMLETVPYLPDERICFWGGWGGSIIAMDLGPPHDDLVHDEQDGPGVIGSDRSEAYVRAIYAS